MDTSKKAKPTKENLERGRRVQTLIDRLGMTQESVALAAEGAGFNLTRNDVNKVCTGLNGASTNRIRSGLASGMKLHRLAFSDYLDGKISIDDLLRHQVLRLVSPIQENDTLKFGQLRGWDIAEREAAETAITSDSVLTPLDFAGARNWAAFGVPVEVTPRFVTVIAWLWRQVATEEMRKDAARLLPPSLPPRSPSSANTGNA